MADTVQFDLVSPQQLLRSEPVEMVVVPCTEGDIGVLPDHSPLIATVRPGVINIHRDGKVVERIFVGGGFAEVSENCCTVLAEEAAPVADMDRAEVEERLTRARRAVEEASEDEIEEAKKNLTLAEEMLVAVDAADNH